MTNPPPPFSLHERLWSAATALRRIPPWLGIQPSCGERATCAFSSAREAMAYLAKEPGLGPPLPPLHQIPKNPYQIGSIHALKNFLLVLGRLNIF